MTWFGGALAVLSGAMAGLMILPNASHYGRVLSLVLCAFIATDIFIGHFAVLLAVIVCSRNSVGCKGV